MVTPLTLSRPGVPSEADFLSRYPDYAATRAVDELRATEYRRLDELGHTYLDYTGGGLYAESQLREHHALLSESVFGNPHSANPASLAMTELVEQTRASVLDYFNAPRDEYVVVFTPNATGALKLVGEAYPFDSHSRLLLSADNHNSVNGIREFARRRGAGVAYAPLAAPELRLDGDSLLRLLDAPGRGQRLFAFPAQSNLSGVQHSLRWIDAARQRGWDVLLDAAAFTPTNRLDIGRWRPDFVALSFYKMFGYPTGCGALIAHRDALAKLRRPWFAGGTITFSSVAALDHYLTPGSGGFEDGTVNYLNLPAVSIGLRWLLGIGVDVIHTRVIALTEWLLEELAALRHGNGSPLVRVYGPRDTIGRGATVATNFVDPNGKLWDCWRVERLANEQKLSLRSGCHCNPGAREAALGIAEDELSACFEGSDQLSYAEFVQRIRPSVSGVVRASLGLATTFGDVARFVDFARGFANATADGDA